MDNFLTNIFKSKPSSVLGIDIGSSAIKVVELKKRGGKAVLETYGALALGPYAGVEVGRATSLSTEKIVGAVLDLLRESHATVKQGGVAIPFSSSLVLFIEMPAVPEKQLEIMVPIEARKYIPMPISEVMLDWSIIPKNEIKDQAKPPAPQIGKDQRPPVLEKTDVLLVAIHNDVVHLYQDIVARSQIKANFFEIEIFGTMRSVLNEDPKPIMVFDMGAGTTKLYIVERGAVRTSHTINRGSQDITAVISKSLDISMEKAEVLKRTQGLVGKEEKNLASSVSFVLDQIFFETNRVILDYQKKHNQAVSKTVLVGGGVTLKGFADKIKSNLNMPVEYGNPFGKVEAPAFLEGTLKENGPEFAVAVGLALRALQEMD